MSQNYEPSSVPSDTAYPRTSDIVSKDLIRSGEISHYERLTNKTGAQDDWMTRTLQSMADPRFVGEENDERILPAVDAWLHFLSTFPTRVNSFRPIDSFDKHGNTLLMIAACFGKVKTVRKLLKAGADVERVSNSRRSALVYACLGPELPKLKLVILRMLLDGGARHGLGLALEISAILGRRSFVRLLIGAGALPTGQLVTLVAPAGREDLDGALARTTGFRGGKYDCQLMFVYAPSKIPGNPSLLQKIERPLNLAVLPSQLHVGLHTMGTEECRPIVASRENGPLPNPLDVAAALLIGPPASNASPRPPMHAPPMHAAAPMHAPPMHAAAPMHAPSMHAAPMDAPMVAPMVAPLMHAPMSPRGASQSPSAREAGAIASPPHMLWSQPTQTFTPHPWDLTRQPRTSMPSPIMPHERTPAHQYMFATPVGQLVPRSLAFEALEDTAEDGNDIVPALAATPAACPASVTQPSTFMSPAPHTVVTGAVTSAVTGAVTGTAPHTVVAPASTGLPTSATLAAPVTALAEGDAPVTAPVTALAEGDAVRVVGRPERWLTGRLGRVHSLDTETGRYLVMLPSLPGEQPPNQSGRKPSLQPREPLAMLLKPRHVARVDTPETAPETAPIPALLTPAESKAASVKPAVKPAAVRAVRAMATEAEGAGWSSTATTPTPAAATDYTPRNPIQTYPGTPVISSQFGRAFPNLAIQSSPGDPRVKPSLRQFSQVGRPTWQPASCWNDGRPITPHSAPSPRVMRGKGWVGYRYSGGAGESARDSASFVAPTGADAPRILAGLDGGPNRSLARARWKLVRTQAFKIVNRARIAKRVATRVASHPPLPSHTVLVSSPRYEPSRVAPLEPTQPPPRSTSARAPRPSSTGRHVLSEIKSRSRRGLVDVATREMQQAPLRAAPPQKPPTRPTWLLGIVDQQGEETR